MAENERDRMIKGVAVSAKNESPHRPSVIIVRASNYFQFLLSYQMSNSAGKRRGWKGKMNNEYRSESLMNRPEQSRISLKNFARDTRPTINNR